MNTPLVHLLEKNFSSKGRFHVPGHKGNPSAFPMVGSLLPYDITEIQGADDLSNPSGILLQSQKNMATAYQSGATLYSASGSTSCVEAMFTLFVKPGETVVMSRNCHVSALRAMCFLDAQPYWVPSRHGKPCPEEIGLALASSGAKAVYITSPDYYGRIADVAGIAKVCEKYDAALLVDNAHGAHLAFLEHSLHPIHLGANASADSAHKTLPCLTPAALLHLKNETFAAEARQALNLYSSTSPSYLVLASLDYAAGLLLENMPDFNKTAHLLGQVSKPFSHLLLPVDDPLKLCITPGLAGWETGVVEKALQKNGIIPEWIDSHNIVLMASPYNLPQDYEALQKALSPFYPKQPLPHGQQEFEIAQPRCSIRQAMLGAKRRLPIRECVGEIAAGLAAACPPGIPVVVPGEVITSKEASILLAGGILELDVVK